MLLNFHSVHMWYVSSQVCCMSVDSGTLASLPAQLQQHQDARMRMTSSEGWQGRRSRWTNHCASADFRLESHYLRRRKVTIGQLRKCALLDHTGDAGERGGHLCIFLVSIIFLLDLKFLCVFTTSQKHDSLFPPGVFDAWTKKIIIYVYSLSYRFRWAMKVKFNFFIRILFHCEK